MVKLVKSLGRQPFLYAFYKVKLVYFRVALPVQAYLWLVPFGSIGDRNSEWRPLG